MCESIREAGSHVINRLERYLNALGTIAAITPLMGLLGTVVGNMTMDGEPAPNTARGLSAAMGERLSGNTDTRFTFSADAMTPHKYVVTAMDVAEQLNITRLNIATENMR